MAIKLIAVAFLLLVLAFGESSDRAEPPASQEKGFGASAYTVIWSADGTPSEEKGLGANAYKVTWDPAHTPSEENGFGASSYPVPWDLDQAPPSKKNGFDASSFAKEENGFDASSFAKEENGFGGSSYPVPWDLDQASPPKKNGFGASSFATQENGFGASSYPVPWDLDQAPPPKTNGFGTSSNAVHRDPDQAPFEPTKRQQIKVQTGMLFLKKNLRIGTVLPEGTMFARTGASKSVNSVSTPLESKYLPTILSHFKIPHNSMKAIQVAETLHSCGKSTKKEEPHMCFSSRDAMARFATRELGVSSARPTITTIHGHETSNSMYVMEQITQLNNSVLPCHPMDFPYEVFYCHRPKEVQAMRVQLKGLIDGMPHVMAIAMCHMNTSDWNEQYFELLDGKRGEPICHYMPTNYILFY